MKINLKYLFFVVCIYLLVFQNFLQNYITPIRYFDEILALLIFPIIIIDMIKKRKEEIIVNKDSFVIIICLIMLVITGLYSNLKYNYQPIGIVLSDLLLVLKFFLVYFLSKKLWNYDFIKKYNTNILKHLKVIIMIFLLLTIGNYLLDIFPGEIRYGIKSNQLFYEHPTYLAAVCTFLLSFLILLSKKIVTKYSLILFLLILTTMRFKAIGATVAIIIALLYIRLSNKKLSIVKLAIIGCLIIVVTYNQISFYFFDVEGSARSELLKTSIEIAKDYFPFGTGFATYGSYYSSISYSFIYYIYNLSGIYGLSPNNPSFITDSFWPMILGQFGVLGTILYLICLVKIYNYIKLTFKLPNKKIYISKIICMLYLIISSTSETAFVHPVAIPFAIIIGIKKSSMKGEVK